MEPRPISPLEMLPHRPPFLFLDRIFPVRPRQEALAWKRISAADCRGASTWPATLLLEVMAQTAAVVATPEAGRGEDRIGVLAGVPEMEFLGPVRPGDTLVAAARLTRRWGGIGRFEVRAEVGGEAVAVGTILIGAPGSREWIDRSP